MKRRNLLFMLCIFVIFAAALPLLISAVDPRIKTALSYNSGTLFDPDNNGLETPSQAIDFTVKATPIGSSLNKSLLCTWWNVFNEETLLERSFCYGSLQCCSFLGVERSSEYWDDTFFLYYGKGNSGTRNTVSANVVYADYSFSSSNLHSDVTYGGWQAISAVFMANAYNSIIFNQTNITIQSPENATQLSSGESVFLNFTVNANATANYTLYTIGNTTFTASPSLPYNTTTSATGFSEKLAGILEWGVIGNGVHNLTLNISANSSTYIINYSFSVNDTAYPSISLSPSLNSSFVSENGHLAVNISANEYANISYSLNYANYTGWKSLGNNKTAIINLSAINGSNSLLINATDMQGNSALSQQTFNFSQNISRFFNATTDKASYNASEQILLLVYSPLNSTYNITIYSSSYYQSSLFASIGPVTYFFYLSEQGNYTINVSFENRLTASSRNITIPLLVYKQLTSNLSVSISANATEANEGNPVLLNATATGNVSSVSFKWDANGDGVTDSTSQAFAYNYSTNKTYTAIINVSDGLANASASITITVRRLNNLTVIIRDNTTGNALENASVRIGDYSANTSSNGTIMILRRSGNYGLEAGAEGYYGYSSEIELGSNKTEIVHLQRIPSRSVIISLLEIKTNSSSVSARFRAAAGSGLNCAIQANESGAWETAESIAASNGTETPAAMHNFSDGNHYMRIRCDDAFGTQNTSTYMFSINQSASTAANTEKIDSLISEIEAKASQLDGESAEAFRHMQLDKDTDAAKTNLQRYKRDLYDMVWRRLSSEDANNFTSAIMRNVDSIRNSTPVTARVLNSKEYVVYPKLTSVEDAVTSMLKQSGKKLKEQDRKSFIKKNFELQSKVTSTIKATHVEITYASGDKSVYTLVEKELSITGNSTGTVIVESIPKEIASDIKELKVLVDYQVLDPDPSIIVDKATETLSYYVKKNVELDKIKETSTMLVYKEYTPDSSGTGKITGLIAGVVKLDMIASSAKKRLIAEIMAIAILATIYLGYSGRIGLFRKKASAIDKLISDAEDAAAKNNYDSAKNLYSSIRAEFTKLPEKSRENAKKRIALLCSNINVCFVRQKASSAKQLLQEGKRKAAVDIYNSIKPVYSSILPDKKNEVYTLCQELHTLISGTSGTK